MANTARELKLEEELGKKKQAAPAQTKGDVFDQVGNDGMQAKVEDTKKVAPMAEEKAPMAGALEEAKRSESEEQKKKTGELAELKKEEVPGVVAMSHRRALTEALVTLETMMADAESLKEIMRPDLSTAENTTRVLAEFAWRMSPEARTALAGADNSDLASSMVVSSTSIKEAEGASSLAAEMGTFAPIAWQMIEHSMHNVGPLAKLDNEEELDVNKARRAFRPVISTMRLSISGLVFE